MMCDKIVRAWVSMGFNGPNTTYWKRKTIVGAIWHLPAKSHSQSGLIQPKMGWIGCAILQAIPKLYIPSTPNNSNETHTFMCLGRTGRFGQR